MGALKIPDLVKLLKTIPGDQFNPQYVNEWLGDIRIDHSSVQKFLSWKKRDYTRNLIYRDEVFELLALCWEPGTCSTIHNHSGQECWVHIHQGALCLDDFELADPTKAGEVGENIVVRRTTRLPRADVGMLTHKGPDNEIHRVVNCRSFKSPAVSLHVYARPFDDCIVYETKKPVAKRMRLAYHTIEGLSA